MNRLSTKIIWMYSIPFFLICFLCVASCERNSGVSSKIVGKWILEKGISFGLATPIEFQRSGTVIIGEGHPAGIPVEQGTWKVVEDNQLHIELKKENSKDNLQILEIVSVTQEELVLKQRKESLLRYMRVK